MYKFVVVGFVTLAVKSLNNKFHNQIVSIKNKNKKQKL